MFPVAWTSKWLSSPTLWAQKHSDIIAVTGPVIQESPLTCHIQWKDMTSLSFFHRSQSSTSSLWKPVCLVITLLEDCFIASPYVQPSVWRSCHINKPGQGNFMFLARLQMPHVAVTRANHYSNPLLLIHSNRCMYVRRWTTPSVKCKHSKASLNSQRGLDPKRPFSSDKGQIHPITSSESLYKREGCTDKREGRSQPVSCQSHSAEKGISSIDPTVWISVTLLVRLVFMEVSRCLSALLPTLWGKAKRCTAFVLLAWIYALKPVFHYHSHRHVLLDAFPAMSLRTLSEYKYSDFLNRNRPCFFTRPSLVHLQLQSYAKRFLNGSWFHQIVFLLVPFPLIGDISLCPFALI